jgi:hypothetical protein
MRIAERTVSSAARLGWRLICEHYPDEWVCLVDVEKDPDGSIRFARVIAHARSMRVVLGQLGAPQLHTVVAHTNGRPVQTPRIEMTDELRNIVRPRR